MINSWNTQTCGQCGNTYRRFVSNRPNWKDRYCSGKCHKRRMDLTKKIKATKRKKTELKSNEWLPNKKLKGNGFYLSQEWRILRYSVLVERGARCEACGASAKDGKRINIDHIKPVLKYPHLALEKKNLQVLCSMCNRGKGSWDETDFRDIRVTR